MNLEDIDPALDAMAAGARTMLRQLTEQSAGILAGEEVLSKQASVAVIATCADTLKRTVHLVDLFKVAAAQALESQQLARNAIEINKRLALDLGRANLTTETALGLVPEPGKRN